MSPKLESKSQNYKPGKQALNAQAALWEWLETHSPEDDKTLTQRTWDERCKDYEINVTKPKTLANGKRSCSICGRPHHSHGLCNMHSRRLKQHGDPNIIIESKLMPKECSVCGEPVLYRGLCSKHHYQVYRRKKL